jgi:hypothetical protein
VHWSPGTVTVLVSQQHEEVVYSIPAEAICASLSGASASSNDNIVFQWYLTLHTYLQRPATVRIRQHLRDGQSSQLVYETSMFVGSDERAFRSVLPVQLLPQGLQDVVVRFTLTQQDAVDCARRQDQSATPIEVTCTNLRVYCIKSSVAAGYICGDPEHIDEPCMLAYMAGGTLSFKKDLQTVSPIFGSVHLQTLLPGDGWAIARRVTYLTRLEGKQALRISFEARLAASTAHVDSSYHGYEIAFLRRPCSQRARPSMVRLAQSPSNQDDTLESWLWHSWDETLDGFCRGDELVVAARPVGAAPRYSPQGMHSSPTVYLRKVVVETLGVVESTGVHKIAAEARLIPSSCEVPMLIDFHACTSDVRTR